MPADYRGKFVLVTGASSGIGHVTARVFARRGAVVMAVARREALLHELIAECRRHSPASDYLAGDLGERAFAEHVVDETAARHGRLDILVNNAAISKHKQFYHMSADEAELVMRVNFLSCVWTTMAAIPHMLRQGGGTIVNVSSCAAKVSPPREAMYAASKAAMNAFSEGLWSDLAGSNIHVAIANRGPTRTRSQRRSSTCPGGAPRGLVTSATRHRWTSTRRPARAFEFEAASSAARSTTARGSASSLSGLRTTTWLPGTPPATWSQK